jgi:hypothetical protein
MTIEHVDGPSGYKIARLMGLAQGVAGQWLAATLFVTAIASTTKPLFAGLFQEQERLRERQD